MIADLRREIHFEPGYDHRGDATGRGCHGLNMRWLVHGDAGSVQFVVHTMWLPSWVESSQFGDRVSAMIADRILSPMAADLGHHWATPLYEGEANLECEYLPAGRCFYDGSGLNAEQLFATLLTEGHDAVWAAMEAYWHRCDETAKAFAAEVAS